MARAKRITVAPFLNVDKLEGENEEESVSVMSPLPPPLKGTFVDKLPTWSQTTDNPDTFLNVNSGKTNLVKKKRPTEKCNRQGNEIQMVHVRPPQFSVLHSAAILGDQVKLQKILKYFDESSLNVRDKYGRTPLIFSVLGDHQECTEILLKAGADLSLKDSCGRNALHWAAHHGHWKCLKTLLNQKHHLPNIIQAVDNGGVSVLHLSTRRPSSGSLPLVLKHWNKEEMNVIDKNLRTPLHWAAANGGPAEYIQLLLKKGAKTDMQDAEGKTPLHWAVASDHQNGEKCIGLLIDRCSETQLLNWQDFEGRTPIHAAILAKNQRYLQLLLKTKRCQLNIIDHNLHTPLHLAARQGCPQMIGLLLEDNADPSVGDKNGATALHYATFLGHIDSVEVLMRHPEVQDLPDEKGRTALMWAAAMAEDRREIIQLLCRHGSALDTAKDNEGNTSLHLSCMNNRIRHAETLLRMGADLNLVNDYGFTALHIAAQLGCEEMVGVFLQENEECQFKRDHQKMLPLHWACMAGQTGVVKLLLKNLVNEIADQEDESIMIEDAFGRTPPILAASSGNLQCLQALGLLFNLEAGDHSHQTALHYAAKNGHLKIAEYLVSDAHVYVNPAAANDNEKRTFVTPLDLAIAHRHADVANFIISKGGLTMEKITRLAATRIQALYRSYKIRQSFQEHKDLLLKHERLRSSRKTKKISSSIQRNKSKVITQAGSFLGHVIEEKHKTASLKN